MSSAATVILLLAACSSPAPEATPAPSTPLADSTAPPHELLQLTADDVWVPYSFEDSELIDPGWVTAIEFADGVFVGAREADGALEFAAIDVQGETLWTQTRPASCAGFTLTRDPANGRALAVLMDTSTTEDALASPTASAYDVRTGELAWGPVEVPGPHVGPGLIFAEPTGDAMGDSGPRTALDPSDGGLAATESESLRVLSEHSGTVIVADAGDLVARDASGERWRLTGPGWNDATARILGDPSAGSQFALIDSHLIRLADGEIVADDVRQATVDAVTRALITLGDGRLRAATADGDELWTVTVSPETQVLAAGAGLLYLRDGDAVRVHNVMTGQVAVGYNEEGSGTILVPTLITPEGAGLLLYGRHPLIAAVPATP